MSNRSPAYPSVSLPVALERVKLLHNALGKVEMSLSEALDCWGYKHRGSAGHRLVSAMAGFGLLGSSGVGDKRQLRISKVLLDNFLSDKVAEHEKSEAIREFAIKPEIYRVLWELWDYDLPSDDELKQFLVDELSFNPRMAPQLLRGYRKTLEFAKVHGLTKIRNDSDSEDTNLDFDDTGQDFDDTGPDFYEDESKFALDKSFQDCLLSEDDTDLEVKIASDSYRASPNNLALSFKEEDTYLDVTTIDVPLEPISNVSEYYLDDDNIDFTLSDEDNGDVIYSSNIDNIGSLLRNRANKESAAQARETTRYQVASNCNIYLSSDGHLDRHAIEALIAQLNLQLELGEFDSEDD